MRALVVVVIMLSGLGAVAQTNEQIFSKAEAFYNDNRFNDAIQEYKRLENRGYTGKALFYNLGNAYHKAGMLGMAIAYYEKALKYDPADEDTRANLRLMNSLTTDKINEEERGLAAWFKRFVNVMAADKWTKMGLLLWLMGFLGFILLKTGAVKMPAMARPVSWLAVVLGGFALAVGYTNYSMVSRHNTAVITGSVVKVHASPRESAKKLYDLHEGARVNLHEVSDGWYEISVDNENYGWVKQEDAVII